MPRFVALLPGIRLAYARQNRQAAALGGHAGRGGEPHVQFFTNITYILLPTCCGP